MYYLNQRKACSSVFFCKVLKKKSIMCFLCKSGAQDHDFFPRNFCKNSLIPS